MNSGILLLKIYTEGHEALEDVDLRGGSSLMDAVVTIDILKVRIHLLFHQKPDDLDVALVASPMHWGMPTGLGWVWDRLEVVNLFIVIKILLLFVDLLLLVFQMRLMLDQKSNNILISVTSSPKDRVPTVLLAAGICIHAKSFLDLLVVVFLDSCHQEGISLLLSHLLLFFLFGLVFVVASALRFNHLLLVFVLTFSNITISNQTH